MKTRENTQNPQSSRGTSTLYKRLGVSNHFHTLFLISNENLTSTSYTFSEFLSANFRKISQKSHLKVALFGCIFFKSFTSLIFFFIFLRVYSIRACTTLTGSRAPPKFKELSNFWRLKCSRSIHVALILNFENCMFRVIRRRPRVRSRGARSN